MKLYFLILLTVAVAGCVGGVQSAAPAGEAQQTVSGGEPAAGWKDVELTNILTGEKFRVSDLKGQTVLVETMAVWCPLCTDQQREIEKAHALAPGEFASVSVDVDKTEDEQKLRSYVQNQGFDWPFSLDPGGAFGAGLEKLFGFAVLSVPNTPIIVVDREGNARLLPLGSIKTAEALVREVRA